MKEKIESTRTLLGPSINLDVNKEVDFYSIISAYSSAAQAFISLLGLLGLFFTVRYARHAWHETKRGADASAKSAEQSERSAKAAEEATHAARMNLSEQVRPWISVKCASSNKFTRGKTHLGVDGFYLEVQGECRNHGQTPATNVTFHASIALITKQKSRIEDILNIYSDEIHDNANEFGDAIFPNNSMMGTHMVFLPLKDIEDEIQDRGMDMIFPAIVGCVNYTSPYTGGTRQTRFAYYISDFEDGVPKYISPKENELDTRKISLTLPSIIFVS